ncbi:MAG: PfkB family carbohydrate kinase, partial [Candidatus Bathyarchaeia archaeon]
AARSLGADVKLISLVGADFPDEYAIWLSSKGVDISGLRRLDGERTTSFIHRYSGHERSMWLRARCRPLSTQDIPESLDADAVHLGPVANDITPEAFMKATRSSTLISLDPQGYLRAFGSDGIVSQSTPPDFILDGVDILKASGGELVWMTGIGDLLAACREVVRRGPMIVIATRGAEGVVLVSQKEAFIVPAYTPRKVVDPTGAGDAFIGAFLAEYLTKQDLAWSAAVGSASASFVVEGYGPSSFGERDEVYARAQTVTRGVKRL